MENTIREFLEKCPPRWRTRNIQSQPNYISYLDEKYPDVTLRMQIDCFLKGESPYCVVCNTPVKTSGKKTCSNKCGSKLVDHTSRMEKQKAILLSTYGVDNVRNIPGAKEKRNNTMTEKYGSLVSDVTRQKAKERSADLQIKGKKTLSERYGVDNPSQIIEVKLKKSQQSMEKYGVGNVSQRHILPNNLNILHNKKLLEEYIKGKSVKESANSLGINFTALYDYLKKYNIGNIRQSSSYETEIDEWLQQYSVRYIRNNRTTIKPLELDFFFPDLNIAIEFNGLAHHSEFLGNHLRKKDTNFKDYHFQKWKQCNEQGITLLSIFEDEWNNKKEIIKRTILRLLKISTAKAIGARKIHIIETTNKTPVISFLNDNHWQGGIKNFQVGLEAYYENKIVAVMTFSIKEDKYLLSRYCVGEGNFPGLFAKMLKTFIAKYNPDQIITFSDNRYATGNIYRDNGFLCTENLREGYSVTNYTDRWHRSNFQKSLIQKKFNVDITNKTEIQLLRELNLDRIWDCGKKKWTWTRQD